MLALIGSTALFYHIDHWKQPRDLDVVGTYDDVRAYAQAQGNIVAAYPSAAGKKYIYKTNNPPGQGLIIEAEIAWEGSLAERLLQLIKDDPKTKIISLDTADFGRGMGGCWEVLLPSLDVLYMLKMSHRYLKNSPFFLKTMRDIHALRRFGASIEHHEFFKLRETETYAYEHPKLNVNKKDFFTGDGVEYVYDHDTIHDAMAHLGQPAYKFYQPTDSQVNVSKDLWVLQPDEIRLHGVLEETYVLALERSQIPFAGKVAPKVSFDIALMKVCTSITSGWFRAYAWEHYDAVQALYQNDYVDRFWKAVETGIVKPYKA